LVVVSLSDRAGGSEQFLKMIADTSSSPIIYLQKATEQSLVQDAQANVTFLSNGSLAWGFLLLVKELFKYRKGYIILSSAVYLNAWLGILKRIGYLQSALIARESTSIYLRFKGIKRATYRLAYLLGYPATRLIICQTDIMRAQFLEHNNFIAKNKVITLPNPINLDSVLAKAEENICIEGEFICAAGRLIPIKGFSVLINAFKGISADHINLKLIILGDGPERNELIELIYKLKLEDRVILKGFVSNPYPYFKKAKLCVVSSIEEGFPNVLLQMVALNTAVVSTLCAGGIEDIPDIVKVKPNDKNALYLGMNLMLNNLGLKRDNLDFYLNKNNHTLYLININERLNYLAS
jgi:glycosyltransferase involved in cell wall biosynthesis